MRSLSYALKEFEKELHVFEGELIALEKVSVYSYSSSLCKKFEYSDNKTPAYLDKLDSVESAKRGLLEAKELGSAICAACVTSLNDELKQKLRLR